jgi:hypothetical protein
MVVASTSPLPSLHLDWARLPATVFARIGTGLSAQPFE